MEGQWGLKALIVAVHKKITTLDFTDVEEYSKDIAGIIRFDDDIIDGNI